MGFRCSKLMKHLFKIYFGKILACLYGPIAIAFFVGHFLTYFAICLKMSATKLKCCVAQERGVDSSTFFEEEDDDSEEEPLTVKTYRRYWIRWLMLLALFILNTSNGMVSGAGISVTGICNQTFTGPASVRHGF